MDLEQHFSKLSLCPEHEGYLLGRGAKEETIPRLGFKTWQPLPHASEDPDFRARYQSHGEYLEGWLLWPLYSPRGEFMGFAGRNTPEKVMTRHMLPLFQWNPIWTGLTPYQMHKIWLGGSVWIVEGIFDLLPMEYVIPERDVVLASERASLTEAHVQFLRRFVTTPDQKVHMVYDNDPTGRLGMFGGRDNAGKFQRGALKDLEGVNVAANAVPYRGKDPGEVWLSGGVNAMLRTFNSFF